MVERRRGVRTDSIWDEEWRAEMIAWMGFNKQFMSDGIVPSEMDCSQSPVITSKLRIYNRDVDGKSMDELEDMLDEKFIGMRQGIMGQFKRLMYG